MAKVSLDARKLKHIIIAGIKDSSVLRNIEKLNGLHAHAGIKGEFALIMGVNNFGDPLHTFPNTKNEDKIRMKAKSKDKRGLNKMLESATGKSSFSPIPARPFLTDAQYLGKKNIQKYINDNIDKLASGVRSGKSSNRSLSPKDFMQGLADTIRNNIRENWRDSAGLYKENADATVKNKPAGLPPLHGKEFKESNIEGWTDD